MFSSHGLERASRNKIKHNPHSHRLELWSLLLVFGICPAVSAYAVAMDRLCCPIPLCQIPTLRPGRSAEGTGIPRVFLTPLKFQQEHGRTRPCHYLTAKETQSQIRSFVTSWNARAVSWHGKVVAGKKFIVFLHSSVHATDSLYATAGTVTSSVFLFSWKSVYRSRDYSDKMEYYRR